MRTQGKHHIKINGKRKNLILMTTIKHRKFVSEICKKENSCFQQVFLFFDDAVFADKRTFSGV